MKKINKLTMLSLLMLVYLLSACSGSGGGGTTTPSSDGSGGGTVPTSGGGGGTITSSGGGGGATGSANYTVGGTVSGLIGSGLMLQDNGADDLSVSANGAFTFVTMLADGAGYNVTVKTQPAGQSCTASSNSGTLSGAAATNVSVICAANAAVTLYARLDGNQEVPAVATSAIGTGSLTVNADTGAVSGSLTVTVAPATAISMAHVHSGDRGVNGGIMIGLTDSGGGVWSVPANATPLTLEQRGLFIAGNLYFNVHTATNAGGEIRGQIDLIALPAPTPTGTVTKLAIIDGAQEIPAVTTTANGTGRLTVNTVTGDVSGSMIILSAATSTSYLLALVHDAAAGNAIAMGLIDSGGGVWSVPANTVLTAAQITSFMAGSLYFNVHTNAKPTGEIRGNIDKTSATLYARLDGAQEVPAVVTSASGTGSLTVDANTGATSGSLTITVAPPTMVTAAHIHDAASGNAVIIPLSDSGGGVWSVPASTVLTAAQISSFISGKLCFNVHTVANAGGDIRGNIKLIAPSINYRGIIKISSVGNLPAGVKIGGIDVTLSLAPGVTLQSTVPPETDPGVVVASGVASSCSNITAVYTAPSIGYVRVALVNACGFGIGEFATIYAYVPLGNNPQPSDFSVKSLSFFDNNGNALSGLGASVSVALQ